MMIPVRRFLCVTIPLLVGSAPLRAQHTASQTPSPGASSPELAQFDFLIGEWTLVVTPKVSGLATAIHGAPRLVGTWTASRAFDGRGIEDELRIMDRSGNPSALSHSLRVYDASSHHWVSASLDVFRTRANESVGEFKDAAMVATSRGVDADGKPSLNRSRFFEIKPAGFRYQQDRSSDDGRTWTEGVLKIDAKRLTTAPH